MITAACSRCCCISARAADCHPTLSAARVAEVTPGWPRSFLSRSVSWRAGVCGGRLQQATARPCARFRATHPCWRKRRESPVRPPSSRARERCARGRGDSRHRPRRAGRRRPGQALGVRGHRLCQSANPQGGLLRRRRPAPGPRGAVRIRGQRADTQEAAQAGLRRWRRTPDSGAAEHGRWLVQPRDRRLAGHDRLDEQHLPHQRRALHGPHLGLRSRRAARRVDRPGGRARRPQGRAGGMGRRAQRVHPGPDGRLPHVPLGPWRRDQFHRRKGRGDLRRRALHHELRPAVRPPRRPRRPGSVPGRRADSRDRLDERADLVQPGAGDAPAGARLRRRQVRPERLHLRQHEQRHDRLQPRPVLVHEGRHEAGRAAARRSVRRRQGEDPGRRARRQDRRHARAGRGARARPQPRAPVPHLGDPRPGDLADMAGRARFRGRSSTSTWHRSSPPPRPPISPCSRPAS